MDNRTTTGARRARRAALWLLLAVGYLVSTVPVGLFLYSLKYEADINIFSATGFHAYMQCLDQSLHAIADPESAEPDTSPPLHLIGTRHARLPMSGKPTP